MGVQSQIDRIQENVASTYSVLEQAGADMPQSRNTDNLAETAASIKAVLYDRNQPLTEDQKAQVRQNIGAQAALTEADREEIVQQVITALGIPVFGTVDGDNNIILTGELSGDSYTVMYEDADGNRITIGQISIDTETELPIQWTIGVKIDTNTGAESPSEQYAKSQSFPVEAGMVYTIHCTDIDNFGMSICYYDANGAYMNRVKPWSETYTNNVVPLEQPFDFIPPDGAANFVLRAYVAKSGTRDYIELERPSLFKRRG